MNKSLLEKNFPIININKKGQKVYNPDYAKYFQKYQTKNYLQLAQQLANEKSTIFRHIYLEDKKGHYTNILKNGDLSCAVFISQILLYFKLIEEPNANVISLEKNLIHHGRKKVDFNQYKHNLSKIPKGAILIRSNQKINPNKDFFVSDYHTGLYKGNKKAISNVVYKKGTSAKVIAEHNAIRDAPKKDHYDKIEIVRYYYLPNKNII